MSRKPGFHLSEKHKKKLLAANLGRPLSEEHKKKISLAKMGHALSEGHKRNVSLAHMGRRPSEETRKKLSLAHMGHTHTEETREKIGLISKAQWDRRSPEERDALIRKQRLGMAIYPNKQEQKMQSILGKLFPGEYKFVGDFSVVIDGKSPDFINVNGKKKIIEVYGDYWHRGENPQDRIALFKPFGYDTLVVWERELRNEGVLRTKLELFHGEMNGP